MTTSSKPSPFDDADVSVGSALAWLRRRAGITGRELGELVEISQAKISKIENEISSPSPTDIRRIAQALRASSDEVDILLTRQAEQERDRMVDLRAGNSPTEWQREIGQLEAGAIEIRNFSPSMLSGLLQTSEYARAVFLAARDAQLAAPGTHAGHVAEAISARVKRQEILDDRSKQFTFIVPETALRTLLGSPDDMPAQLRRLQAVARQQNVTMKVFQEDERWPHPPVHSFSLLDDRCAVIDLYNTVVVTRGRSDLRLYRSIFDTLADRATTEIEPILAKYRRTYLKLATEGRS